MTSRAWRSVVVLTSVAIASAVLAATRALAGPAPAGHPVPGWARGGDRTVARPVTSPIVATAQAPVQAGGLAGGAAVDARAFTGPIVGPAVRPVTGPGVVPDPADPFRWPLDGELRVVVAFDPPAKPWLPGHRGVDLAAAPAQLVYAAGPGTVAFAGHVAGVGVVSIDHAGGLRTTYEPVEPTVHPGDRVIAGTPIGRIGARIDGCPTSEAACLHWGLRRGDVYLDPLALLGLGRVRLLP